MVYPCVLPLVYPLSTPCVQEDVHAPVVVLFVLQAVTSHALSDGTLGDPKPACGFLDGEAVYPASIPFVHDLMLDSLEAPRKPSGGNLAALTQFYGLVIARFAGP